ncbi:MAG: SAV_2336 N-terminal domain-related protein [Acidimicrobiales bacterium]
MLPKGPSAIGSSNCCSVSSIAPETLRVLVGAVRGVDPDAGARTVADVLWLLACQAQSATDDAPTSPDPAVDTGATPPRADFDPPLDDDPVDWSEPAGDAEASSPSVPVIDQGAADEPAATGSVDANVVRLPAPAALPDSLALARAFRPFRRHVPASRGAVLDVEGTVRASAVAQRLVPMVRPRRERWLSLEMLIDASASMEIWDDTFRELANAARHSGAFAEVTVRYLHLGESEAAVTDNGWEREGARQPLLGRRGGRSRSGRTLVLIGSDAVDEQWRVRSTWRAVEKMGTRSPVAVIDPLPAKLWRHTAIGADLTRLTPPAGAVPNSRYTITPTPAMRRQRPDPTDRIGLPILELADASIRRWGRAVANGDPAGLIGLLTPGEDRRPPSALAPDSAPDPAAAVRVFKRIASRHAWRLAVLVATAPTTSLAVIRAIQSHALPGSNTQHLAEFIVSGLVQPARVADHEIITFRPGCREALLDAGGHSVDDAFVVYRAVTTALASRLGVSRRAVEALIEHPGGNRSVPKDAQAFAEVARAAIGLAQPAASSPARPSVPPWAESVSLTGHTNIVTGVAFGSTPDGRLLLASASRDHTVRVWDPTTGTPVGQPLTGHTSSVTGVAFGSTPDGRLLLASASWDHTVRVWDPATGTPVGQPLTGHTNIVTGVAFGSTPDGRLLLASASWDDTVRVWDPATGRGAGRWERLTYRLRRKQ